MPVYEEREIRTQEITVSVGDAVTEINEFTWYKMGHGWKLQLIEPSNDRTSVRLVFVSPNDFA